MATIGFTYYDEVPTPTVPTIQELINLLSAGQKLAVLNGFAKKILPKTLAYNTPGISRQVIVRLYTEIDKIEELCRTLLRGELIITPAVIEDGIEITPAIYNTPPIDLDALKSEVAISFSNVFTAGRIRR